MANPDLQKIFKLVEETTGYGISVSTDASMSTNAAMRSATINTPAHLVLLNPKCEEFGNILVALQCVMLLQQWKDKDSVADYVINPEKLAYFEGKVATELKRFKFQDSALRQQAAQLVRGLLHQLNSVPSSILAGEWCWLNCPSLHSEQRMYMGMELRQNSASLTADAKASLPRDVYERSVTMSAAFAMWWSEIGGERQAVLPYEVMGYAKGGAKLLALLRGIPDESPSRYVAVVNAWAEHLQLKNLIEWKFRKG